MALAPDLVEIVADDEPASELLIGNQLDRLRGLEVDGLRRGLVLPQNFELVALEGEFPDLVSEDSPTQRVAGKPLDSFPTVEHAAPML